MIGFEVFGFIFGGSISGGTLYATFGLVSFVFDGFGTSLAFTGAGLTFAGAGFALTV
jgi:hypothetical protein